VTPYRLLFDRVLTRIDPEVAHRLGFAALRAAEPVLRRRPAPSASLEAMGLTFPGPLGLAAGFDKNAEGIDAFAALGFSFVEVGTVTGEPQPGNPTPRLFRLPEDRAIVNRMGFNNHGAEVVAHRLAARRAGRHRDVVVGVNIGRTKAVPASEAVADYEKSTRLLAPYADYLVVNVSSPNTPGLRDLQAVDQLGPLLGAVRRQADAVRDRHLPLLVKIAPDLADKDVLAVADLALDLGLDGIVATNTTIGREGLRSPHRAVDLVGTGGLSGPPLRSRAVEVLRLLRERVGPDLTLVAAGGIETAEDARERLAAGATLLQAYTAFVYEGALWPSKMQRELSR
jgi:dihydroorotate dehydrogenase